MRVIYGVNPVLEALKAGGGLDRILLSSKRDDRIAAEISRFAAAAGVRVERAAPSELDRLTGKANHQGVAAVAAGEFNYADIEDLIAAWKASGTSALFLILDSVQDPQNLGSLLRAASAAGAHGVIIPKDRASEVTPAVIKASAGAAAHVPVAMETNIARTIERLKKENVWVAAVEAGTDRPIWSADLAGDTAIVIGSEGRGIRRLVLESCDYAVSIPLSGKMNSLNAAQAGAIALFEARRQRASNGR